LLLLVFLGAIGLDLCIRWALERRVRAASAARSSAIAAAVILASGVLTSSYFFLAWPDRPGLAAQFDYGYAQAADILEQLPPRPVVISDVWRAQDLLAFYGLDWPRIESVTPGQRVSRDSFVRRMPAYFLTDQESELARLQRFGYKIRLLEIIKTPQGENRFWLARVMPANRLELVDVSGLEFVPPQKRYPSVVWQKSSGLLMLQSKRVVDGQKAVAYAISDKPMSARMRVTASIPAQAAAQGDLMVGFGPYRDPSLGSPDKVSPFTATFVKLTFNGDGSYRATGLSQSIDDRSLSFDLGSGRGPTKVRVAYSYVDNFKNTFQILRDGRWSPPVVVSNYIKRPLYLFTGLLSETPTRATLSLDRVEATSRLSAAP
jgi:hypothetical protein